MQVPATLVEKLKPDVKQIVTGEIERLYQPPVFSISHLRNALIVQLNDKHQAMIQRDHRGVSLKDALHEALRDVMPELGYIPSVGSFYTRK